MTKGEREKLKAAQRNIARAISAVNEYYDRRHYSLECVRAEHALKHADEEIQTLLDRSSIPNDAP